MQVVTDNGFRYPPRYNIAPSQQAPAIIWTEKNGALGS